MSEDVLKDLFVAASPAPPARDIGFVIAVMEKVERRRLMEGLVWRAAGGAAVTALMAVIMPHVTPGLVAFGQDIVPAVTVLTALGAFIAGVHYLKPVLRGYGWRI